MKTLTPRSSRRFQIAGITALAVASLVWISPRAGAEDPATQPASQPAQTVESLANDLDTQFQSIQDALGDPSNYTDAAKRAAAAPKVIPGMKKMVVDLTALATVDPEHKQQALDGKAEFTMQLSLFGDADATKLLSTEAESTNADTALEGKRGQLMIAWINSSTDSKTQTDIADKIEKLAKDNTSSTSLTVQIYRMTQLACSSPELGKRLETIATDVMKNEAADEVKQKLTSDKEQEAAQKAADAKLAALENKPLTIAGTQPDGKAFTTADWKGKVILVDFWATWCGPCREELPRVTKIYSDYHAKGLEILGVSNDYSADDLTKFLADNKDMPWPQLLDADAAKNQQWNPITLGFGINGIPTMFLIDKKGICRTVSARENMEEMIPKLLAEK